MKNKKGFTLIELLAVIVILAIIALIATPMVLKYIKTSKEGSYDSSINNILRAAENYYAGSMLNTKATYPQNFMFPNNKELGVKGKQPDSGYLTIYEDGSTYLYAVYDEIIYTKLPNEVKAKRYDMVVGDDTTWTTDGKGTITKYNVEDDGQTIEYQLNSWMEYMSIAGSYAMRDEEFGFDFSLSLKENIEKAEQEAYISRSVLPLELNKEIDEALEIFNTKSAITEEEAMQMVEDNRDKLPYFSDYYDVANNGGGLSDMKVYQLIKETIKSTNLFIIPNYIKHSDGTKEKITSIDTYTFRDNKEVNGYTCVALLPLDSKTKGKDLIIPEGIEVINYGVFSRCLLNSVTMANSIKTLGDLSFEQNSITTVVLPNSLETIGMRAFLKNNISGDLIIPKSVISIGEAAFHYEETTPCPDEALNGAYGEQVAMFCKANQNNVNKISSVTFEKGSKIETIESWAFYKNKIENITIPGSIKKISYQAFNCETLKSATIERAKGSDLKVESDAFGSITPVYKAS